MVKLLATRPGASVDARDSTGCTALWTAARAGNSDCVAQLLHAGADATAVCDRGLLPRTAALIGGHSAAAALLTTAANAAAAAAATGGDSLLGAAQHSLSSVDWTDEDILSILELARTGSGNCLEELLACGASPDLAYWESNETLGSAAAASGDTATVRLCLRWRCDFASKSSAQQTAAHTAVSARPLDSATAVLALLLSSAESGLTLADALTADVHGCIPLHQLAARGGTVSELLTAASSDSSSTAAAVVERALQQRDSSGRTLLHCAAAAAAPAAVAGLLALKADVTAADASGNTALHLAVLSLNSSVSDTPVTTSAVTSVVEALMSAGADPLCLNRAGQSAVVLAVQWGAAGAVAAMLQHEQLQSVTALQPLALVAVQHCKLECLVAITAGHSDALSWLATPTNSTAMTTNTASSGDSSGYNELLLCAAMRNGHWPCIAHLIAAAPLSQHCSDQRDSILHCAAACYDGELLSKVLLKRRDTSDALEARNSAGDTPLLVALRSGSYSAAAVLMKAGAVTTAASHCYCCAWLRAAAAQRGEHCACKLCTSGRSKQWIDSACKETLRRAKAAAAAASATKGARSSRVQQQSAGAVRTSMIQKAKRFSAECGTR
jgi:ankyrin repeat protein